MKYYILKVAAGHYRMLTAKVPAFKAAYADQIVAEGDSMVEALIRFKKDKTCTLFTRLNLL